MRTTRLPPELQKLETRKEVSTKPPPPLAGVSEIACLCFTGGIFDEQTRRKPLAIAADALRYGD
jgi:hypothetical protein